MPIHSSSHCDLCGALLVSRRENGWKGNSEMTLTARSANICVHLDNSSESSSTTRLCYECNNTIIIAMRKRKKEFTLSTCVEFKH